MEKNEGLDTDARTVFIRKLPFTFSDKQLEEFFSEVGPVRRCFTVKEKGSEKHRGFGFVHFALAEDAKRAVEQKDGSSVQGRKIKVELAKRREPLQARRDKKEQKAAADSNKQAAAVDGKLAKAGNEGQKRKNVDSPKGDSQPKKQKREQDATKAVSGSKSAAAVGPSPKQRPARTIVVGGLVSPKASETVSSLAKKLGPVESVQSLSEHEISENGLSRDGCRSPAIAIVFGSVKLAREAVATFHKQQIGEDVIWARQLGGEGSKLKKWRVIVRNLPFSVTEEAVKDFLKGAGYVWELTLPRGSDGKSKGFGFVGFTSKSDAEKAIQTLNGKKIAKRSVAVDWAVAKKKYEKIVSRNKSDDADIENEETASESEIDDDDDDDDDTDDDEEEEEEKEEDDDDDDDGDDRKRRAEEDKVNASASGSGDESDEEKDMGSFDEVDLLNKVLDKVVKPTEQSAATAEKKAVEEKEAPKKKDTAPAIASKELNSDDSLERTVFVRNLPLDGKSDDVRKQFSAFGQVKSFRFVLHPLTKKPKGTAFVEFTTVDSAKRAIEAAEGTAGITIGGRNVYMHLAVDRDSARTISKNKSTEDEDRDRRNLYLNTEGLIKEGTPSAEGVSKSDMQKRKALEKEKATKLRSPNFHVSRTRLSVHNLPKSLSEKELKQIFLRAVKSRATKQNPVIKQAKILEDEKKVSRGVAFVEFAEHQHALVALRVLNNNPTIFSKEKRPIVEFAIENAVKLKQREARLAEMNLKGNNSKKPTHHKHDDLSTSNNSNKKRKRNRDDDGEGEGGDEGEGEGDGDESEKKEKNKNRKENEIDKNKNKNKKKKKNKKEKIEGREGGGGSAGDGGGDGGGDSGGGGDGGGGGSDEVKKKKKKKKRRVEEKKKTSSSSSSKAEEKLEKLVSEYKSKYFKSQSLGPKKTLDVLKRWFD